MKKKFFAAMLLCLGMLGSYHTAFAMEKADVELYYLGRNTMLDNPIYVENGNYFVPLRECAEQIGYEVSYTPSLIIVSNGYEKIEYHIDSNTVILNDIAVRECDISDMKNINGACYINVNNFYYLLGHNVITMNENGKEVLQITDNKKTYLKSDFQNSLSLFGIIEKNKNGAVSPISMKLSLAMVANGTTGQTQKEILNVLGYDTIEQCNDFVSNEILKWSVEEKRDKKSKNSENEGNIYFANGLWYNSGNEKAEKSIFNENFVNRMQSVFKGVANIVTNDTAVQTINQWVEQQTNGMLKDMISDADFQTALINTTYFKCCWADEFQNDKTEKGIFYNIDNTQSEIDFMHDVKKYTAYYCESDGWQMLGLPYSDKKYTMYIFLPEKGKELKIDDNTINTLLRFKEDTAVKVTMPKFNIESDYDFTDTLKAMGIKGMFSNTLDFSNMYIGGNQGCVTDVLQKTKIIVNEQGTEATSGTALHIAMGVDMTKPAVFQADRPFIYMITASVEEKSDKILFPALGEKNDKKEEVLFIGQYVTAKQ